MRAEQVGVGAAVVHVEADLPDRPQQVGQQPQRAIAIVQPRPQHRLVGQRPSRAVVAAQLQRAPRSRRELRRAFHRDLLAGIEAPQVRHVAVMRLHFFVVVHPLLQLPARADAMRQQARARGGETFAQLLVLTEHRRCLDDRAEEIAHDLLVDGRPHADMRCATGLGAERVLGRVRHAGHEASAIRRFDQRREVEPRRVAQRRIHALQEREVLRVGVVVVQMPAQPTAARVGRAPARVLARRREAPHVGDHVRDPAISVVVGLCRAAPWLDQRLDERDERLVALDEVGRERGPVVHLHVDVEVVVAVPRRLQLGRPQSLQVRGQGPRPRRRREQVTAVGEVECEEIRVLFTARHRREPRSSRHRTPLLVAEFEPHATAP